MTREVWRIARAGSLGRLARQLETLSPPAPGEARVRVEAVGLNLADIFACLGLYSATPKGPFIPGLEFAGVVEEMGAAGDVRSPAIRAGDRVFGLTRFGAYATRLNAEARLLTPVPQGWSSAEAAALPVHGLTAWYGLIDQGRVCRDELVLVHSAAGGVGLHALRILRSLGARAVAAVGREEKRRFLIDRCGLSPDLVIVRDRRRYTRQLASALAAARSDGFDVVFDAVGGPFLAPAFDLLRARGRLIVYGAADFMPRGSRPLDLRLPVRYLRRPRIDPLSLMSQNRSVIGFNLIWLWGQAHRLPPALTALQTLCPDPPFVGRRFSFDNAPEAMRFLQSGASIGKVVLEAGAM